MKEGKKTEEEQMDDVVIVFFMCSLSSTQNHKSKKKTSSIFVYILNQLEFIHLLNTQNALLSVSVYFGPYFHAVK